MVFKKIIFQKSLMANETPSRPPSPLHGKCHLKFPFWFFAPFPYLRYYSETHIFSVHAVLPKRASSFLRQNLVFYKHCGWNALVHVASGLVQHLRWKGQNCKPLFFHMVFISSLHYIFLQELNLISSSFSMFDLPPMSDPIIQNSDFGVLWPSLIQISSFSQVAQVKLV